MNPRLQAGDSKLGCAIWIVLALIGGLIAFKTIPVRIASAELEEFMSERAQFGGLRSNDQLIQEIVGKAADLNLPLKAKDVSVERLPHERIRIRAKYTIELNFPFYSHDWVIEHDITKDTYGY